MTNLHTLTRNVVDTAAREYATDPDRWAGPHSCLFTHPATPALIDAESSLAAAIGPDNRTRAELSARNMSAPDPRPGAFLAGKLRRAAMLAARHAAASGVTGIDPGGLGACECGNRGYCEVRAMLRDASRAVLARGVTPGRTVARITIRHSCNGGGSVPIRAFAIDGCGGPFGCDYVGVVYENHSRSITPDMVTERMRNRGAWRLVTRDQAAAAIIAAGYRLCDNANHDHDFTPADAGPDVWRRSGAPDWHVNAGGWVAYVQLRESSNGGGA